MKIRIVRPTWYEDYPTMEANDLPSLLDGVWREAANLFSIESEVAKRRGKAAPLGIQPFINEVVNERFHDKNWEGEDGRYSKGRTWVRLTFRHQMSLGSDFLDALRLSKSENFEQCIIVAAEDEFLRIITPRDWRSLCSFSKLSAQMAQLVGIFNVPLLIGELKPASKLSPDLHRLIYGSRLIS